MAARFPYALVICAAVCATAGAIPAHAEADGPDFFKVDGLKTGGTLSIRARPEESAMIVGTIPGRADGLRNLGCQGGLSFVAYEAATDAERKAARSSRWCRVAFDGIEGWASGMLLAEGNAPDEGASRSIGADADISPSGSIVDATWYLSRLGDDPAFGEAFLSFRADGTVSGSTGCNRINGRADVGDGMIAFGPLASTSAACEGERLEAQEATILSVLSGQTRFSMEGGMLHLRPSQGDAALVFGSRPEGWQTLLCSPEQLAGFWHDGDGWTSSPSEKSDDFVLTPMPAPNCEGGDFSCRAANPNYQIYSSALGDDFVGCHRVVGLGQMSCDVFSSTLKVNFGTSLFAVLDDRGFIGNDSGGDVVLEVGRCVPVSP